MGRFLLDGRYPQSSKDAVKRFKETNIIGDVSPDCWRGMMIKLRDNPPTSAFNLEDMFIRRTAKTFAHHLLPLRLSDD